MAYIGKEPVVGNFQVCDAITVVNGQAAYSLTVGSAAVNPESANHMLVSLNGILQKPGSSFTISGSTITFASNLVTNDVIDFIQILGNVLDLGQPSDDTVKTASLQANAVTGAKLNTDTISAQTALAAEPADTDEFLVSDAGVLKRIDYSLIKGGGSHVLLLTSTLSSTANVTINNTYITSTYRDYLLTWSNVHSASNDVAFNLTTSVNNAGAFASSAYKRVTMAFLDDGSATGEHSGSNNGSEIRLTNEGIGNAAGENSNGFIKLHDFLGTDNHKYVSGLGVTTNADGDTSVYTIASRGPAATTAINAIKLALSSGNFASGVIKFYGCL